MAPLNAPEFSAEEGIREGRQQGARRRCATSRYTGRLEYVGVRGLTLGASFWTGAPASTSRASSRRSAFVDVDAR